MNSLTCLYLSKAVGKGVWSRPLCRTHCMRPLPFYCCQRNPTWEVITMPLSEGHMTLNQLYCKVASSMDSEVVRKGQGRILPPLWQFQLPAWPFRDNLTPSPTPSLACFMRKSPNLQGMGLAVNELAYLVPGVRYIVVGVGRVHSGTHLPAPFIFSPPWYPICLPEGSLSFLEYGAPAI